jgi:hypothetical protein
MLPGFRFLFAAIILSISILIFGLGAAALLRAAHEEFASNPTWRAPPETVFAQQSEPSKTVLAALVVEPPFAEKPETPATAAPEAPAAVTAPPAEPEQAAAAKLAETSPLEAAKAEPVAETPPASEPVPAHANVVAEAPAAATETKIAAIEETGPAASETAPAASTQASTPAAPEIDDIAAKIAALGDAPVTVETRPPSKAESTAAEKSADKKRRQAKRARERRRLAALRRAMLARQTPLQPAIDLFGQTTTTASATATAINPPHIR